MDAPDRLILAERILCYQEYYNRTAKPLNRKITRSDLQERLRTLNDIKSENLGNQGVAMARTRSSNARISDWPCSTPIVTRSSFVSPGAR